MQRRSNRVLRDYLGRLLPGTAPLRRGGQAEVARLERLEQLRAELETTVPFGYPTSGDPNIIGEHEVPPVRCECCNAVIPWAVIKGWRN